MPALLGGARAWTAVGQLRDSWRDGRHLNGGALALPTCSLSLPTQCTLASPPCSSCTTQPTAPPAMARPTCLVLALALVLLACSTSGARLLKGQAQASARASATGQGASWASSTSSTDSGEPAGGVVAGRGRAGWSQGG